MFGCSDDESNYNTDEEQIGNCSGNIYQSIIYQGNTGFADEQDFIQEWTVENACHTNYRDGTPIPEITDITDWGNATTGAWCYYDNDPTKGMLYNYYAIIGRHDNDPNTTNKEFAPEGWHIPSSQEWVRLINILEDNGYNYNGEPYSNQIGKAVASNTGWVPAENALSSVGNNQSTNNSSGFNIFPVGYRRTSVPSFQNEGITTIFWWTTPEDNGYYLVPFLQNDISTIISQSYGQPNFGLSVRFVKD